MVNGNKISELAVFSDGEPPNNPNPSGSLRPRQLTQRRVTFSQAQPELIPDPGQSRQLASVPDFSDEEFPPSKQAWVDKLFAKKYTK